MKREQNDDQYSEQEAQRRFMAALKAAVNTPPKPLSEMKRKKSRTKRGVSPGPRKSKSKVHKRA
jgi:hypothetical protein